MVAPMLGLLAVALLGACAGAPTQAVAPVNASHGVALRGYDPVAYFVEGEARPGDDRFRHDWRGAEYHFASAEHRDLFAEDPERYAPQYGGYCAIAMAWNRIADIDPQQWSVVDGRLYLNNSGFAHLLWSADERGNIESADENWAGFPKHAPRDPP